MLSTVAVVLDSREYLLARDDKFAGRRWQVQFVPNPALRVERPDVIPGPGNIYTIVWDDWSGGVAGDLDNRPNTIHQSTHAHGTKRGSLRPVGPQTLTDITPAAIEDIDNHPTGPIIFFNGLHYFFSGRYCYKITAGGIEQEQDFGVGEFVTDAIVHNNELVVALHDSPLWTMTAGEVWTQAAANEALHFAHVLGRLWRSQYNSSSVSNIGATDNPRTAVFSAGIPIGTTGIGITGLGEYGERLAVAKPEGLFLGDSAAQFPNVLPEFTSVPHPDNGKQMLIRGADIFYPHFNGLVRYNGGAREEVGLWKLVQGVGRDQHNNQLSPRFAALCTDREYIWAVMRGVVDPPVTPAQVLVSRDNLATFTNVTTTVTDGSSLTTVDLGNFGSTAPADYLLVSSPAPFFGMRWIFAQPNGATLTNVELQFLDSLGVWTALDSQTTLGYVHTMRPNALATPYQSGDPHLAQDTLWQWTDTPLLWSAMTVNGTLGYWVRLAITGTTSAGTAVADISLDASRPRPQLYRGKSRGSLPVEQSLVWEPYGTPHGVVGCTAIAVLSNIYPYPSHQSLFLVGRRDRLFQMLPSALGEDGLAGSWAGAVATGDVWLPKHDGGTTARKRFLGYRYVGRNISAAQDFGFDFSVYDGDNGTATYAGGGMDGANDFALPFSFDFSGYWIQPHLEVTLPFTDAYHELLRLEVDFTEVPTTHTETYTMLLELSDHTYLPGGGSLPEGRTQWINLQQLLGDRVTLVDPMGIRNTVQVMGVQAVEVEQSELNFPITTVQVTCQAVQ
jgi:hypothetical protein